MSLPGEESLIKFESTPLEVLQIIRSEREGFAYGGPDAIDPADLPVHIESRALPAAFAASHALSAPLGLPFFNLLLLQVPDHPSSNPSIPHNTRQFHNLRSNLLMIGLGSCRTE
jgi:hypothetical protein